MVAIAAVAALAACGGGSDSAPAPTATTETVVERATQIPATPVPTATAEPTAIPATPTAVVVDTAPDDSMSEDGGSGDPMGISDEEEELFLLGEEIYLVDATDGVSCSICHGKTGLGDIGPNIRGKKAGDVAFALDAMDAMDFLRLSDKEILAVGSYLEWLGTQPE